MTHQTIIVLDFGSQYTQLIARRLRELSVYSEIWPPDTPAEKIRARKPGRHHPVRRTEERLGSGAPKCDAAVFDVGTPVLGICYGMQLMARHARRHGRAGAAARVRPRDGAASSAAASRAVRGRAAGDPRLGEPRRFRRGARPPASRSSRRAPTRRSRRWRTRRARCTRCCFIPEVVHTEQRPRDPPQLRVRRLRLHRRLDDGVVCRGGDGARFARRSASGRVVCALERRRRLDGRGADHSSRDRRPADVHLRRQRRAAAGRGGADPSSASSG